MNSALTLQDEHDAHVQSLHSEAISRTAAAIARQRADAIAHLLSGGELT